MQKNISNYNLLIVTVSFVLSGVFSFFIKDFTNYLPFVFPFFFGISLVLFSFLIYYFIKKYKNNKDLSNTDVVKEKLLIQEIKDLVDKLDIDLKDAEIFNKTEKLITLRFVILKLNEIIINKR